MPRKAKKAPAKKTAKKGVKKAPEAVAAVEPVAEAASAPTISKTAFVLAQPPGTKPKQIAEAASAAGIEITAKYVSNILSAAKSAGKKAPAKKTAAKTAPAKAVVPAKKGRSSGGNKSEFIRSVPKDVKPAEVVKLAAAKGISITAGLVHTVRSQLKKKGVESLAPTAKRPGRPPSAHKSPAPAPVGGSSDRERQLVALAVDVGLARAVELIEGLRARIGELI